LSPAINHDKGAMDWISKLVDGWPGKLSRTQRQGRPAGHCALFQRSAGARSRNRDQLVVNNLAKTDETADRIMRSAVSIPSNRPWATWELGMLANRGVEPERIHQLLVTYIHEPEPQTRFWAVEGLAHLGTDETIKDFLEVLGSDVSMDVRERAGCSLAKSAC
jgi:hypothetical protein